MRYYTCDGCKKEITEGVSIKTDAVAVPSRLRPKLDEMTYDPMFPVFRHYCGTQCYLDACIVPTPAERVTISWACFTEAHAG